MMSNLIIRIYDYMRSHRMLCVLSFVVFLGVLVMQVLRLNYSEDISDFLPLDGKYQKALKVYQDISGANKLCAIVQYKDITKTDPDVIVDAVTLFKDEVTKADKTKMVGEMTAEVDMDKMAEVGSFVYTNIPYFLEEADYDRMEKLLSDSSYVRQQLGVDKQMLMFPTGGLLSANIQRDPLNLFTPVVEGLQHKTTNINYELYNGYIFSPDMQKGIIMMSSPFGSSETENNTKLLNLLNECSQRVMKNYPDLSIHIIGGPAIAVGNSSQIKTDSILSVSISVVLILLLLFLTFRSVKNLLLIVVSIGWGWLFAVAGLALVHDSVSVIVIGISSVILGIAVNYPLHLIAHLSHTPTMRNALKEIIVPLVVGNITTVGAFMCLVPLQSVALRDLGLFSSFLLIGTIIFVVLYLPHVARERKSEHHSSTMFSKLGDVSLENKTWIWIPVAILTAFFGYYSLQAKFDSNISHINYMTDEQKADMEYFQKMMFGKVDGQTIYVVASDTTLDKALDKSRTIRPKLDALKVQGSVNSISSCNKFVVSRQEQARRLEMWKTFVDKYSVSIAKNLQYSAAAEGFAADSFDDFYGILHGEYEVHDVAFFQPLMSTVFASNITKDAANGTYNVIDELNVDDANVKSVEEEIKMDDEGSYCFDIQSMNSAIANNLSNDFNYIGWACGFIVFFFLWFSFGSLELALLSFLPMAISWIWILGIMALLDIQFNIVNVILATFIFGQGDDYTIFMTEGAIYEYSYRKKMLASYKNSIIISALIMFIGIGTLIFAKHPALHSLAEVTIVGMFSVVLMAYLFPPLIYKWMVMKKNGDVRIRPISIRSLLSYVVYATNLGAMTLYLFVRGWLMHANASEAKSRRFQRMAYRCSSFVVRHIPSVKYEIDGAISGATVCVCKTRLDVVCALAASENVRITLDDSCEIKDKMTVKILEWIAHENKTVDVQQLTISGTNRVMADESCPSIYSGHIVVSVGMPQKTLNVDLEYCKRFVIDRYRYKGKDVTSAVCKNMRKMKRDADWLEAISRRDNVLVVNNEYGDVALLLALLYPEKTIFVLVKEDDNLLLARYSAEGIVTKIEFLTTDEAAADVAKKQDVAVAIVQQNSGGDASGFAKYTHVVIK